MAKTCSCSIFRSHRRTGVCRSFDNCSQDRLFENKEGGQNDSRKCYQREKLLQATRISDGRWKSFLHRNQDLSLRRADQHRNQDLSLRCADQAWLQALSGCIIIADFDKCGVYPFKCNAIEILDDDTANESGIDLNCSHDDGRPVPDDFDSVGA